MKSLAPVVAAAIAVLLSVAVFQVHSRLTTAPSDDGVLSVVVTVGPEPTPLATVRRIAEPSRSGHGSGHHHPNVCGGGETSPGVGLPSQKHGSSLVTCRLRRLDTTAYCDHANRTASGVWPRIGMAASNLFPFGTRLRVPGIGVVVVRDRIGWGSQLDLFFGTDPGCEQRAIQFGRRSLLVEVLS